MQMREPMISTHQKMWSPRCWWRRIERSPAPSTSRIARKSLFYSPWLWANLSPRLAFSSPTPSIAIRMRSRQMRTAITRKAEMNQQHPRARNRAWPSSRLITGPVSLCCVNSKKSKWRDKNTSSSIIWCWASRYPRQLIFTILWSIVSRRLVCAL